MHIVCVCAEYDELLQFSLRISSDYYIRLSRSRPAKLIGDSGQYSLRTAVIIVAGVAFFSVCVGQ